MQRLDADETLVAASEVRELLARLTTQSIESLGPEEPRTLGGLALKTGVPIERLRSSLDEIRGRRWWHGRTPDFVLVGLVGATLAGVLISRFMPAVPPPLLKQESPLTPVVQPQKFAPKRADLTGLVPLSSVTYGPDSGNVMVDPSFHPSKPLPEGVSISAQVDSVLWGAGDAHASALANLDKSQLADLRTDLRELLEHVRSSAAKRSLALALGGISGAPAYSVNLDLNSYNGSAASGAQVPIPGAKYDDAAREAIDRAADLVMHQLEQQIQFQEESRRANGP